MGTGDSGGGALIFLHSSLDDDGGVERKLEASKQWTGCSCFLSSNHHLHFCQLQVKEPHFLNQAFLLSKLATQSLRTLAGPRLQSNNGSILIIRLCTTTLLSNQIVLFWSSLFLTVSFRYDYPGMSVEVEIDSSSTQVLLIIHYF